MPFALTTDPGPTLTLTLTLALTLTLNYSGQACAQHSSRWCWNDCAGRGTCVDGWCRAPFLRTRLQPCVSSLQPYSLQPCAPSLQPYAPRCRCRPPFYGPGCAFDGSRPLPHAAAPHGAPPRGPFRVYVYDVPPLVLRGGHLTLTLTLNADPSPNPSPNPDPKPSPGPDPSPNPSPDPGH